MIPESVRWLLARKKKSVAERIVNKVARINKVILSRPIKDSFKDRLPLEVSKRYLIQIIDMLQICLRTF